MDGMNVERLRNRNATQDLDVTDLDPEPFTQFRRWHETVRSSGHPEPDAMVLSTVDSEGRPGARVVLLRQLDHGFVFYTNQTSDKAVALAATGRAALVFAWQAVRWQVRVEGRVELVSNQQADAYFAGRPRGSQIGAWASDQSRVLPDRAALDRLVHDTEVRFDGLDVPRPPDWGGYRVIPDRFELWQGRPDRLHDRLRYRRPDGSASWTIERLAP